MRDHIVPHLSKKKTTREMWEALNKIYQSDKHNRKMVMIDKLRETRISKLDNVATHLTKITQVSNELAVIGETVDVQELTRTTLTSFSKPWEVFFSGNVAWENLPKWECM